MWLCLGRCVLGVVCWALCSGLLVCACGGESLAVCGFVSFAENVVGFVCAACMGIWVSARAACFFRGAARLATFILVTQASTFIAS